MNIFNKIDRALSKINQPTPIDKIITGIARPIDADKLKEEMVVKVNDKIYIEQTSLTKKFSWEIFIISAAAFSVFLYKIFLDFDSILIRIISVIVYIAICIGGGGDFFYTSL